MNELINEGWINQAQMFGGCVTVKSKIDKMWEGCCAGGRDEPADAVNQITSWNTCKADSLAGYRVFMT